MNDHGKAETPTFVSNTDTKLLIGDETLQKLISNPSNTIFDIKIIGCSYNDTLIQNFFYKFGL